MPDDSVYALDGIADACAISSDLPQNQPDARRGDDRRMISGIVHLLKVGCSQRGRLWPAAADLLSL
jgi:hypothetical protein